MKDREAGVTTKRSKQHLSMIRDSNKMKEAAGRESTEREKGKEIGPDGRDKVPKIYCQEGNGNYCT